MKTLYKAICLDLDGTVYKGIEPIKEAVSFIKTVQNSGIEPYYVTNNSSSTQKAVQKKLQSFGIETTVDRIMTSAYASAQYCQRHYEGAAVQVIGGHGLHEALKDAGIEVVTAGGDVVMMGIDREVTYEKLAQACLAIRQGALLIGTNGDKAIPTERGFEPGNGSLVKLVSYSTGVEPLLIGKPEAPMLQMIQQLGDYTNNEMVMVGDNYETDILAGIHFGIDTIHVNSGVTSTEELKEKATQPTYAINSLTDWERYFK